MKALKITPTRDASVDLLRLIACFMVIGSHVDALGVGSSSRILWPTLLLPGVTIFFILTGFFLYRNESFPKLLKKSFLRLYLPVVLYMIVMRILTPMMEDGCTLLQSLAAFPLKELAERLLSFTAGGYYGQHLWYMFTYFLILIAFPLLKCLCNDEKRTQNVRIYLIVILLSAALFEDIRALFCLNIALPPVTPLGEAAALTLLGFELYRRKDTIRASKPAAYSAAGLFILIEFIRFFASRAVIGQGIDAMGNRFYTWNSGTTILEAVSLIVFILHFPLKNERVSKAVTKLGSVSFYVYLFHEPIYIFLDNRGFAAKCASLLTGSGPVLILQEILYFVIRIGVVFLLSLIPALTVDFVLNKFSRRH